MNTLVQYVRNNKNHIVGMVVAIDKHKIGWSLCKKGDRFDKQFGLLIAIGRSNNSERPSSCENMPKIVAPIYGNMQCRAQRYYKGVKHEDAKRICEQQ